MDLGGIPQLSVVLPVYNADRFLADALDSILDQDFGDFECVTVNDGSTDRSPSILEEYRKRDARIRVLHQANLGLVETLNRAISLSRASLIARIDADDVCLPGRFKAQVLYFKERQDLGVLGGQIQLIDEESRFLRIVDYPPGGQELAAFLHQGSPVAHPAVMFRKAAVEKAGLYRKAYKHAEDYDLWLRVQEAGYAIENLRVPLIGYRQHAERISVVHRQEQAVATLAAKCAHRVREAGLPDPTSSLNTLDERVFDLFPSSLIADLRDELFSVRLGVNPFESRATLIEALVTFRRLPASLRRTPRGTNFLMEAIKLTWKYGLYSLTAEFRARAIAGDPLEFLSMMRRRAGRVLRRSIPQLFCA